MTKVEQLESLLKSMDSGRDVLGFKAPVIGISGNFRKETVLLPKVTICLYLRQEALLW